MCARVCVCLCVCVYVCVCVCVYIYIYIWIIQDELVRQENERKSLAEALKMQKDTFDEYWAHKRREMEEEVKHA